MSDVDQMSAAAPSPVAAAAPAFRAPMAAAPSVTKAYDQAVNTLKQGVAAAVAQAPKFDAAQAAKAMQDVTAFNRATMKAFAQSGEAFVAGMQDLYRRGAANSQAVSTQALAGLKSLAAARSMPEALQLQASLMQQSLERAMTEGTQLARESYKLAGRVAAPLTERAVQAAEQLGRRAA